jgi:alpha-mannosidase
LNDLADLIKTTPDLNIRHSTPEEFFADVQARADSLPVHAKDLNPWAVGCYTSMIRVKQKHRQLENELYATEKMAAAAWSRGLLSYPQDELHEAMRDLATAEFHDILPGSSIQPAEEMALRLMDHGLELVSRVRARTFFALAQGQPKAQEGQIPILVYNPHPFPIKGTVECEFQLQDFNWTDTFTQIETFQEDRPLPTQVEKEVSNLNLDWRKRVVFDAELAPSQMNRFDCHLNRMAQKPALQWQAGGNAFHFTTDEIEIIINAQTGLVDRYRVHGVDYFDANACCPLVMLDSPDPWGMRVHGFRNTLGAFELLSRKESERFSGVQNPTLLPVRVVEDGAVRTVIEAVLGYGNSTICLRYKLPKHGTEIEIEVRVHWNEKDRMLKLSLPTPDKAASYMGQVAYGADDLLTNGDEVVAQKWVAVVPNSRQTALTVINDGVYGSDFNYGELRLSLLRSPAYSGHPIVDRPVLPQDRYSPRIDQGERLFQFWINGGPFDERLRHVDRESLAHNEKPMALSFFPVGGGQSLEPFLTLSDDVVQITAIKKAEEGDDLIVRLFEPTGKARTTVVALPCVGIEQHVELHGFEIRTFRVNVNNGRWVDVNLIEQPL